MTPEGSAWYSKLISKHVREDKSLFQCSNELDLGLTVKELESLQRDKDFAAVLRTERWRFYKEIAADPNRSKTSAIGSLLFLADRLIAKGAEDKGAKILLDVCKLEGWLSDSTEVNIFGDVSQADINKLKERVAKNNAGLKLAN
jgi:hypothetical protein